MSSGRSSPAPRRRLTWDERRRQLIGAAWDLIRDEGTDALTLARVATRAGVTKPIAYDHFATRNGLLAALYGEFDVRQTAAMRSALGSSTPSLESRATVLAQAYVECVLAQGRELPEVLAALRGSPELEQVKRECEATFLQICRDALAPFAAGDIGLPGLRGVLGAAEALAASAVVGEITPSQAVAELAQIIAAMVLRQGATRPGQDPA